MARFTYMAMDDKGVEKSGAVEAENQVTAINKIREMGLRPTQMKEDGAAAKKESKSGATPAAKRAGPAKAGKKMDLSFNLSSLWGGSGVKPKVLTIFTRQLATLVDAGLPLLRGLSVLQRQERYPVLNAAIADLASSVESGSTFSEALYQHPRIFNKLYINMVKAGEVGGVLEVVLNRLSQFMEKAEQIKGKIKAAMFYPIAVMFIATAILTFLMVKIVPKFEEIFKELLGGTPLPDFTRFVLGISSIIKNQFLLVLGVLFGLSIAIKLYGRTNKGQLVLDRIKLHLPLFGDLLRKTAIGRFSRTLGTLVASGVPILQSLQIVRDTSGNRVVADAVGKVHDSVKEGESIVQPIEASGVFPPMVVSMIDVGETTGALPDMLMKIADTYDDEVDNAVTAMVSLLEPIMIVFLAVVVGGIVIALFLPMITMISKMSDTTN